MSSEKTITPGEGEKPVPPAVICSKCKTFGCDDHVPDAGKKVDPTPTVKPDVTVPVVDAVWVTNRYAGGNECLYVYSRLDQAKALWSAQLKDGTARIVRIRSVDEEARKDIDELRDATTVAYNNVCGRLSALESRLNTLCDLTGIRTRGPWSGWRRLEKDKPAAENPAVCSRCRTFGCDHHTLPAAKPEDKTAARVVKAPKPPVYGDGDWLKGVQWEAKRWVDTLTSQGITVADEGSSK